MHFLFQIELKIAFLFEFSFSCAKMTEESPPNRKTNTILEISGVGENDQSSHIEEGGDLEVFGLEDHESKSFSKAILSQFSSFFSTFDGNQWNPFQTETRSQDEVNGLWNCLLLCYGGSASVTIQDSVSTLKWVKKLSIDRHVSDEDLVAQITDFILNSARENFINGATALRDIARDKALLYFCFDHEKEKLENISPIVFSSSNIENDYPQVVDGCLMKLPAQFLDFALYPSPQDELRIRQRYSRFNGRSFLNENRMVTLVLQNDGLLNSAVLGEIEGIVGLNQVFPIALDTLVKCVEWRENLSSRLKEVEKERDEWKKRFEDERKKTTFTVSGEDQKHIKSFVTTHCYE